MKRFLLLLLVCMLLLSLCSCDEGSLQNTIDSKPNSQGDAPEMLDDDKLKADALSVAEKFLIALFELDFVEADALSNFDFKDQLTQVNEKYSNTGIYFEGETVHAHKEVFESKVHFFEALTQRLGPVISVGLDASDIELFPVEDYETVVEDNDIYGVEVFTLENLMATRIAIARFNITWKVMDTNSLQGPEEEIHEGTVDVLMVYTEKGWIVLSPSIIGLLMGFEYIK